MKEEGIKERNEDVFHGYEYNYFRIWEKLREIKERNERIYLCGMKARTPTVS